MLAGILIGIASSLVAGLILMWKGELAIQLLQDFPSKWRIRIYTRAYLRALIGYPGDAFHRVIWELAYLGLIGVVLYSLHMAISTSNYVPYLSFINWFDNPTMNPAESPIFWMLTMVAYSCLVVLYYGITSISQIIPHAHRDFQRIKDCMARFAPEKQFLEYIELEASVKTREDLLKLFSLANQHINAEGLTFITKLQNKILDERKSESVETDAVIEEDSSSNSPS